jgi:hypothetical protein
MRSHGFATGHALLLLVVAVASVVLVSQGTSASPGTTERVIVDNTSNQRSIPSDSNVAVSYSPDDALVILSTLDMGSFHEILNTVQRSGGESLQVYPPTPSWSLSTPWSRRRCGGIRLSRR